MKLRAYAKINLYLSVLDRREDGYHNIESVMQSVSLADTVTLEADECGGETEITVSSTDGTLPTDGRNLAYRAAELYLRALNKRAHVRIHIEKNIPVAAGLAGGSTDGAAVLRGLNEILGGALSRDELLGLGLKLGADVPFCLTGGTYGARGIGEELSPLAPLPDCSIVIVRPHGKISTAEAYGKLDSTARGDVPPMSMMTGALARGSLSGVCSAMYNAFETVLDADAEALRVKAALTKSGALAALLSGSGPSVYGIFYDEREAARAVGRMEELGFNSTVTRPVGSFG